MLACSQIMLSLACEYEQETLIDRNYNKLCLLLVSVPVLLSTLQLLRSVLPMETTHFCLLVRFRCLCIIPDPLRFVKYFFLTFFVTLKSHLVHFFRNISHEHEEAWKLQLYLV